MNPLGSVAPPEGAVTTTSRAPVVGAAGVTAVIVDPLTTTTPVAATPPTVTAVPLTNPLPVTVIAVPPASGPEPGMAPVIWMDGVGAWKPETRTTWLSPPNVEKRKSPVTGSMTAPSAPLNPVMNVRREALIGLP